MIDIQIYNQDKEIRHSNNVWWNDAKIWLNYTKERLTDNPFTSIEVQIYTSENMPVDSGEFKTFEEVFIFLDKVLENAMLNKYKGIYETNPSKTS